MHVLPLNPRGPVTRPDGSPFTLAYRKQTTWDDSWEPGWVPVPTIPDHGMFAGWEDMPEAEFIFSRFRVDVELVIGGRDFSATINPILDFALAWQHLPRAIEEESPAEGSMSVQGLSYLAEKEGDRVVISSNWHPERRRDTPFHPYRVSLARNEFEDLVEQIVSGAFAVLYEAHPRLHDNRYLNGLRQRIGL